MELSAQTALVAMTVLLIKHAIADYFFQTLYMVNNKGRYLHPGGLAHAFVHILCTLPVFLVIAPATQELAVAVIGGEFLIHYHIDWLKEQLTTKRGIKPDCKAFWNALGIDQLMHGLTYIAIVWVLLAPPQLPKYF